MNLEHCLTLLVANKDLSETWLLEVKYRKSWTEDTAAEIEKCLLKQAATWKRFLLLLFIAEPELSGDFGGENIPMNHCRVFKVEYPDGKLLYTGRYSANSGPFSWGKDAWMYSHKLNEIFDGLDKKIEEKTIKKACDFISRYPEILDECK